MNTDISGQASELEELIRNNAIQAHRINHNAVSATHCIDCCKPIPEPRRSAMPGRVLCIDCKEYDDLVRARG